MDGDPTPLVAAGVSKQYRQAGHVVPALRDVTMEVPAGRLVAVMGASGSGKSTLLHLIAGLTRPDSGKVELNGTDLASLNDRRLTLFRRRHVGLVFQAFNLIPTLTAEQNVALPLLLDGRPRHEVREKTGRMLELLGLSHRRDHRPDALSGGEQQRVAIGRALVNDPAVILADEPTGNLDSANSQIVCELLRTLATEHHKAVVLVTHEPAVAAHSTDVVVLRDGRLLSRFENEFGTDPQALAQRYQDCLRPSASDTAGASAPSWG